MHILGKMEEVIDSRSPRTISAYAPRFYTVQIPTDKIRDLIGPGGKMIRWIIEQTGVKIDVEDSGKVNVASSDRRRQRKPADYRRHHCDRRSRQDLSGQSDAAGGFRRLRRNLPGTEGLLHISEIAEHRIADVRDELRRATRSW